MWKLARQQVGAIDKLVIALKPLKTNQEASKWLLRAWIIACFADKGSDDFRPCPEGGASQLLEQMLEVVRSLAANASAPECVSLTMTVLAKLPEVDIGISDKSSQVLRELVQAQ